MVGDLLSGLQKLVEWKTVVAQAAKVPELERRIALLESRIGSGNANPHTPCPSCGIGRWHKKGSQPTRGDFAGSGALDVTWGCNHCSYTETRLET